MKKRLVILFAVVLLAVLGIYFSQRKKSDGTASGFMSEPGLYVHAVSNSDDTEAWQKWQSVHDDELEEKNPEEKFFFLPFSAGKSSVDVYKGMTGRLRSTG